METLVISALHQPSTRAEIEQIRGVSLSQLSIDVLLETGQIQPWGLREAQGRPTLWVTTPRFLARFGLRSLRDLPGSDLFASRPVRQSGAGQGSDGLEDGVDAGVEQDGDGECRFASATALLPLVLH
jgi:segregation and condensation protein B